MAQQANISVYTGTEVISLDEAKDYLRVDHTEDNDYITELIKIARMQVLKDTNTPVVETTIIEYFDKWPTDNIIQLNYDGIFVGVFLSYYNSANVVQLMIENTDWRKIDYMGLPKIQMINTPSLFDRPNAIAVTYSVKPNNDDTTRTLKIAMYMLIQHYYDNRSPVSYLKVDEMPLAYKHIITQYKNYIW